jgi:hypothetical protein
VPLLLQPARQLAGERRLTRALKTREHDHRGRLLGELQPPRLAAEDDDELLVNDLDDLLRRVQRLRDLGAAGPFLDPVDELFHHRERHIGFQQREPDFARGGVDVGVGQLALAAQLGEDPGQAIAQGVEHAASLL